MEIKDGSAKDKRQHELRAGQKTFAANWPGVCIKAVSPEDAEQQLNLAESFQYLRTRET